MEERLNNAMVLFGQYRSTGNVALLYQASSEVDAYIIYNPDNPSANNLKREIEVALHHVR